MAEDVYRTAVLSAVRLPAEEPIGQSVVSSHGGLCQLIHGGQHHVVKPLIVFSGEPHQLYDIRAHIKLRIHSVRSDAELQKYIDRSRRLRMISRRPEFDQITRTSAKLIKPPYSH